MKILNDEVAPSTITPSATTLVLDQHEAAELYRAIAWWNTPEICLKCGLRIKIDPSL